MKKILSVILIMLTLVSCSGGENFAPTTAPTAEPTKTPIFTEKPTQPPSITQVPTKGGVLTIAAKNPLTLNPLLNSDASVDLILRLLFEPLAMYDENLMPIVNKKIVDNVTFANDGLSVEITPSAACAWENGEPVTGADVAFSYNFLIENAGENSVYAPIKELVERCEVSIDGAVLHFYEPRTDNIFALMMPIISKNYYAKEENPSSARNLRPIGDGEYMFEQFTPMKTMTLKSAKSAYITEINVILTRDERSEVDLFERSVTNAVSRGEIKRRGVNEHRYRTNETGILSFNYGFSAFGANNEGKIVRTAIAALLDDGFDNAAEILSGRAFNLIVSDENAKRLETAENLARALRGAGVDVTLEALAFGEFERRFDAGEFSIALCGAVLPIKPHEALEFLESVTSRGNDERLMELVESAANCLDFESYAKYIDESWAYIGENAVFAAFDEGFDALVTDANVAGDFSPTAQNPFNGIENWYIEEK